MSRNLAIIPARSGSKRIPEKNITSFLGRPLLAYSLQTARESGLFEVIHVSTDSERVATVCAELDCRPTFLRAPELADDFTPIAAVLQWVQRAYLERGQEFDTVALVMATAPLLEPSDLREGYRIFSENRGQRTLVAVAPHPAPIERAFRLHKDNSLVPVQPDKSLHRTQDLEAAWYDSGAFAIFSAATLAAWQPGSPANFCGLPLPAYKSIDIDEPDDLLFAEVVYRGLRQLRAGNGQG